jgi:hypothetical protein
VTWLEKNLRTIAALNRDDSHAAVALLLETDLKASASWAEFQAHVIRRNALIHEGQAMKQEEAAASLRVVQEMWVLLADAASKLERSLPASAPSTHDPSL